MSRRPDGLRICALTATLAMQTFVPLTQLCRAAATSCSWQGLCQVDRRAPGDGAVLCTSPAPVLLPPQIHRKGGPGVHQPPATNGVPCPGACSAALPSPCPRLQTPPSRCAVPRSTFSLLLQVLHDMAEVFEHINVDHSGAITPDQIATWAGRLYPSITMSIFIYIFTGIVVRQPSGGWDTS